MRIRNNPFAWSWPFCLFAYTISDQHQYLIFCFLFLSSPEQKVPVLGLLGWSRDIAPGKGAEVGQNQFSDVSWWQLEPGVGGASSDRWKAFVWWWAQWAVFILLPALNHSCVKSMFLIFLCPSSPCQTKQFYHEVEQKFKSLKLFFKGIVQVLLH